MPKLPTGKKIVQILNNINSLSLVYLALFFLLIFLIMPNPIAAAGGGPFAYVTNSGDKTVSVIDTVTNSVTATVNVGKLPFGVAASPDGKKVYVVNYFDDDVSVIDTATNTVTATINVGSLPFGIAVSPDGKKLFVANFASNNISVINTATNTVAAGINTGKNPWGIAVNPDGTKVYAANLNSNSISVIDTTTNTVVAAINVGNSPWGVAVNPDGKKVFVTNSNSNTVSVIDTITNTVVATANVGNGPWGITASPDGTKIYVANSASNSVSVIDTSTNAAIATVNVGSLPCGVTVNPQGTRAYVVNSDSNSISVIDTAKNIVIATVNVGNLPVAIGQFIIPTSPALPIANFSSNVTQGNIPLSVQFTDLSKNATTWNWDFGDGTNSIQQNPTHIYTVAGTYTVNLTASNANGANSKSATITVLKPTSVVLPAADFKSNVTTGNVPLSVQFTDLSKNATAWNWNFGDGTYSTQQNPMHIYSATGTFTINLTASNANGTNSKTSQISVTPVQQKTQQKTIAAFSASPISGYAPLSVAFVDKSTGSSTSWSWNFGDKSTSTAKNPVHTYTKAGQYTVSLMVKNAAGSNTATKSNFIVVNILKPPLAAFSASPTSGKAPLSVTFTDQSTGSITSRSWNFGDRSTSTAKSPVHRYTKAGKYTVTLTVNNAAGSNTAKKTNYITLR